MRARSLIAMLFAGMLGCTSPTPLTAPRRAPVTKKAPRPELPDAPLWEPLEVNVDRSLRAPRPPLTREQVLRTGGMVSAWDAFPLSVQDAVLSTGLADLPRDAETPTPRMGPLYVVAVKRRLPIVVTADALFELVHLGLSAALAEVEATRVVPALQVLLRRLEARLSAETRSAPPDLLLAYRTARGVVAVTQALLELRPTPPADLASVVMAELALARPAHGASGLVISPLLGVPFDYAGLQPRGGTPSDSGVARALGWASSAPLLLLAREEQGGVRVDTGLARRHARAALLLARGVRPDVDREAAAAWDTVETYARLVVGTADGPTLRDLDTLATAGGLDVRDDRALVDVVRLDRLRRNALRSRAPKLDDGLGPAARLIAPRHAPDAEAIQEVARSRGQPGAAAVLGWLTAEEVKRPHHESIYLSALDALGTALSPSASEGSIPAGGSAAWAQRNQTTAAAAWTTLRHDLAGAPRAPTTPPTPPPMLSEAEGAGPAAFFVEPNPELVAKLVALVRQTQRALGRSGLLAPTSPARSLLADVEGLLTIAFEVAFLAGNDEPADPEQLKVLASVPWWMASIEDALASSTVRTVTVHTDRARHNEVVESTGAPVPIALVVREPGSGRLILAYGLRASHRESYPGLH